MQFSLPASDAPDRGKPHNNFKTRTVRSMLHRHRRPDRHRSVGGGWADGSGALWAVQAVATADDT